jgi:UDP-2,3-diacylglucosamine pyrophosphatase LpxH
MDNNILVVSDIHLGSPVSRVKALAKILKNEKYNHLILNGDIFDNRYLSRYKKHHWKVLSLIRKIAKKKHVTFIKGNHDAKSVYVTKILGIEFVDQLLLTVNNRKMLFMHFQQFDPFIFKYPLITTIAEHIYYFFQSIDRTKTIARFLKRNSKSFLDIRFNIRRKALKHIENKDIQCILGGHIHYAESYTDPETNKEYYNSGSFCDDPSHYILIDSKGNVKLKEV